MAIVQLCILYRVASKMGNFWGHNGSVILDRKHHHVRLDFTCSTSIFGSVVNLLVVEENDFKILGDHGDPELNTGNP